MDRLVTFDCFDTVITRAVGAPSSVGHVVARRLAAAGVVEVEGARYVELRSAAASMVFRRCGDDHDLDDIAVQLADLLGLEAATAAELARVELEVERELSREVPGARALVEEARASGAQVGFLSDTPLPHDVVAGLLTAAGLLQDGDLLWVSNELRAGKERGTAYFEVARRLGGAPADWRHVGDDARADVKMARLSGVVPQERGGGRLNRYERRLDAAAAATGGFSSLLSGASRRTRLLVRERRPDAPRAEVAVLAGVAAPLLVGYLLWALRQAERAGASTVLVGAGADDPALLVAQRLAAALGTGLTVTAQEGGARGGPRAAVVTTGWHGPRDAAAGASSAAGAEPLVELRWQVGASTGTPAGSSTSVRGYLQDVSRGTGAAALPDDLAVPLEVLTGAVPSATAPLLREVLDGFCDELLLDVLDPLQDVRVATWAVLQAFWSAPEDEEARVWARVLGSAELLEPAAPWRAAAAATAPPLGRLRLSWSRRVGGATRKVARARHFAAGRRSARRRGRGDPAGVVAAA